MVKAIWVQSACLACGMRFYDLNRSPILCPGCGAEFDLENIIKSRKGRSAAKTIPRTDVGATDDDQNEDDDNADENCLTSLLMAMTMTASISMMMMMMMLMLTMTARA